MHGRELTYRRATESDAEALVGVINRAFAVELQFFSNERIDRAETLEHMQKGEILVAEDEDGIAGCVYVELIGEGHCYFGLLSVEPDRQGQGLGRKLIEEAEDFARENGCPVMEIRVLNVRTELPPLYEKLGYAVTRTQEAPPNPNALIPYHFIIMEKRLTEDRM